MADYRLEETPPLGGFAQKAKGAQLLEEAGAAMAAVTIRNGREKAFAKAFAKTFGGSPPGPTGAVAAKGQTVVASAQGQVFVLMETTPAELLANLEKAFASTATVTDQSDGWARLALTGPRAVEALERLAMVDLSDEAFGVGSAARTVFEHCTAILIRGRPAQGESRRYTILTPRSSAASLLHALTTSPPFTE